MDAPYSTIPAISTKCIVNPSACAAFAQYTVHANVCLLPLDRQPDINALLCMQGLIAQYTNPVLADGQAGLATSATAFAAVEVSNAALLRSRACIDYTYVKLLCIISGSFLLIVLACSSIPFDVDVKMAGECASHHHMQLLCVPHWHTYCHTIECLVCLQRYLLFQRLNNTVPPTNETVAQVFARLSAYRDQFDGSVVSSLCCLLNCYSSWN